MDAIILAGGFGTRLQSVVSNIPKPMADIAGKPFLAYLITYLKSQGISKITLSVHHQWEIIADYFQDRYLDLPIRYVIEPTPLGTGGAIQFALQTLELEQPVFIINGDTFVQLDFHQMYQQHCAEERNFTMALRCLPNCARYGQAILENGRVVRFKERGTATPGYINAGVYLLNPAWFLSQPLPEIFSFEQDFLYPHIPTLKPAYTLTKDYFIDIGIPADYQRAVEELPEFA